MDPEEVLTTGWSGRRAGPGVSDEDAEVEHLTARGTRGGGTSTR